ncbi:MAG: DUF305 domain-containing protein [Nocardioidaceae bacterium]|nr:DUF305 domain-containing protein [Nocardioidaceae bacterium]NUS52619.1 DUF305 domain-containing protein [Nocardioidaceae bacterium]
MTWWSIGHFDELWLQMMVEHHDGAITMAKAEQARGKNPDAVALAKSIASSQQAEVEQMNQWLTS